MKKVFYYGLIMALTVLSSSYAASSTEGKDLFLTSDFLPHPFSTSIQLDDIFKNARIAELRDFPDSMRILTTSGSDSSHDLFNKILDRYAKGREIADIQLNVYQSIMNTSEVMKICCNAIGTQHKTSLEIVFSGNKIVVIDYDPSKPRGQEDVRVTLTNTEVSTERDMKRDSQIVYLIFGARRTGSLVDTTGKPINRHKTQIERPIPPPKIASSDDIEPLKIEVGDNLGNILRLCFSPSQPEYMTIKRTTVVEIYRQQLTMDPSYMVFAVDNNKDEGKSVARLVSKPVSLASELKEDKGSSGAPLVSKLVSSPSAPEIPMPGDLTKEGKGEALLVSKPVSSPSAPGTPIPGDLTNARLVFDNGTIARVQVDGGLLPEALLTGARLGLIPAKKE